MKINQMKAYKVGLVLAAFLSIGSVSAYAASSAVTHSVTAVVPSVISLTSSTGAMTFNFTDYLSGTDSPVLVGSYNVKCNTLTTTGSIKAALSATLAGMDFKADPQAYTSTSGTGSFAESYSGYSTVGTSAVKMYDQAGGSGGTTARGTFSVNYKFTATTDLASQTYGPVTLTVTLFDT